MSKSELARKAGVSISTFKKWLIPYANELKQLGVKPYDKILNPKAVQFVCEKLAIDI